MIKREISERAFGWLSYTFSRVAARRNRTGAGLVADRVRSAARAERGRRARSPGGGWELGARFQLASGRPDTPVIGATYDADTGSYDAGARPDPLDAHADVHARSTCASRRRGCTSTWSLGLYLDVINVANSQNVEATEYDYRYRESAPVTSFPILPTLGLRGTW